MEWAEIQHKLKLNTTLKSALNLFYALALRLSQLENFQRHRRRRFGTLPLRVRAKLSRQSQLKQNKHKHKYFNHQDD